MNINPSALKFAARRLDSAIALNSLPGSDAESFNDAFEALVYLARSLHKSDFSAQPEIDAAIKALANTGANIREDNSGIRAFL